MADIVKSVEFFDLTITDLTNSGTLSMGQNVDNCVPFISARGSSNTISAQIIDVFFSSAAGTDFINVSRLNNNGTKYCKVYVVEFDPTEVKVQQGNFSISTTSTTEDISSVVLNRTAMVFYNEGVASNGASYNFIRGKFLTTSGIEFRRASTSSVINGHYFIFEALNDQFVVEHKDWTCTSATSVAYNNPMSVAKGLLITSYYNSYTGIAPSYILTYSYMWNRHFIKVNKSSSSYTSYGTSFFIKFLDEKKHMQRWYVPFGSSDTTKQYELDYAVNLDSAMVVTDNIQSTATVNTTNSSYFNNGFISVELLTASGIEVKRNNSGTDGYTYIQVFDWNGITIPVSTNFAPLASGVSCAKSVENVSIDITGHTMYKDYVLTKGQDIDNCVPFASSRGDSNYFSKQMYDVWFESPGLLCVLRGGLDATSVVNISVVEFYPDQVDVQFGSITVNDYYENIQISSVNRDKTALIFYGSAKENNTNVANYAYVRGRFVTNSGIEFYKYSNSSAWVGTYYVFEDKADNFIVEQHEGSFTTYSRDISTMEMEPNTTFIIGSFANSHSGNAPSYTQASLSYQGTHTVGFNKSSGNSTSYYCLFIVKFIDNREHVQNIYQPFSDSGTYSYTQPLYDRFIDHTDSLSLFTNVCSVGTNNTSSSSYLRTSWCTIELVSGDTLKITRVTTGTTINTAFSVVDWVGYSPQLDSRTLYGSDKICSVEQIDIALVNNAFQASSYLSKGQNGVNCVPFYSLKSNSGNNNVYYSMATALLFPNSNKVSICRGLYPSASSIDMRVNVVEFNPKFIKVQQGDFYLSSTTSDVNIETVDRKRAFIVTSYYGYGVANSGASAFMEVYFSDDSTITFERSVDDAGVISGRYYVVEALNEEFYVQTIRGSSNSTNKYEVYPEYVPRPSKLLLLGSYRSHYTSSAPSYMCGYIYNNLNDFYIGKESSSGTFSYTIFAIEFSNLDVRVQHYRNTFDSSTTSLTTEINPVEEERACVIPPTAPINSTVNTSSSSYFDLAFSLFTLTTSGLGVKRERIATGSSSRSDFQVIEFPEYNKFYFDGTVTEQGVPAPGRIVRAYRKDTGELMDETVSISGTGYFYLETTYSGTHDIVCLDDLAGYSYNDLIYGDVIPTTISGR